MALLRELLKAGATTVPQRTYEDAPLLRLKVRLWQALLLLLPCLPDEASAHEVAVALYDVLLKYEHPLSLRYLLEWSLLRIFLAYPNLIHTLFLPYACIAAAIWGCWDELNAPFSRSPRRRRRPTRKFGDYNERAAVLCSMAPMALQLARHLTGRTLTDYLCAVRRAMRVHATGRPALTSSATLSSRPVRPQVVPAMMPWCVSNHYILRLLVAVSLFKIVEICQQRRDDVKCDQATCKGVGAPSLMAFDDVLPVGLRAQGHGGAGGVVRAGRVYAREPRVLPPPREARGRVLL